MWKNGRGRGRGRGKGKGKEKGRGRGRGRRRGGVFVSFTDNSISLTSLTVNIRFQKLK